MALPVIIDAVRTPLGRKGGAFQNTRPDQLYASVLNALLERNPVAKTKVEDVITGCVTQVGEQGANVGRLATLLSNLPCGVAATTVNRLCGSSQQAIHFGAQAIAAGDNDWVIAGGVESMSRVTMFSDIGGGFETLNPKLHDKYEIIHQGLSAERIALKYGLSRQQLDEYSRASHEKAAAAITEHKFDSQLVNGLGLDKDEGVRFQIDMKKMGSLVPVFKKDGVITAANSSQLSDGAAALLLCNLEKAKQEGLKPRAQFRSRVAVGGDPTLQLMEVIGATQLALKKAKLSLSNIDVIEINEAFASVVLGWMKELKIPEEKVNPQGGAIAHGHPLGATGAILMTKLINQLEQQDATFGLQVMCIGHGMATATILERL